MSERMEDRVHALLIWDGLAAGMSSEEAIRWADSRMKSSQAGGIRLALALADAAKELGVAAETASKGLARGLAQFRRRSD